MKPLTSVIINNYNYGRFLGDAIDSALAQTSDAVEVLVVDDGSTDNSRAVIASYGDRVIPLLKENGGQGSTLNAGFAGSHGDVVIFLDADDLLFPAAVERAVELLMEPGVVKVHWPLLEVDDGKTPTGRIQPPESLEDGDMRERVIRDGPTACSTPPTSGNAWCREFLHQVLPMPEREFAINSDAYLVTLAWIYGKARAVATPQGLYRVHGRNHFASKPPHEKRDRHVAMYLHRCDALDRHLRGMGITPDVGAWKRKYGIWPESLQIAAPQLAALVPEGARFILVDDNIWAKESGGSYAAENRQVLPFLEHEGHYWGRPESDAKAIQEVKRLHHSGAQSIVFAWCAFWWLEHYAEFAAWLRANFGCVIENDCLIAFDLNKPAGHPN